MGGVDVGWDGAVGERAGTAGLIWEEGEELCGGWVIGPGLVW
jgi:hypothetical protein